MSIVWLLALLALVGLLLFGFGAYESYPEPAVYSSGCFSGSDGIERCSPELADGNYQLPDSGVVIHAAVNNGPVSPEDQQGYDIQIEADGGVTIEMTGPAPGVEATPAAATTSVETSTISVAEVQSLL